MTRRQEIMSEQHLNKNDVHNPEALTELSSKLKIETVFPTEMPLETGFIHLSLKSQKTL